MKRAIVAIAVVAAALGGGAYAKTIYVDGRATGANNGVCWADAYKFLQDALADADSAEKPVYVRVAQGVYQPDRSAAEPNGTGDRMATFRLTNGVTVQGGYAGFGHADPNTRDIELYETILSGDLDANDMDVNDPADLPYDPSRGENAYHVVTGSGTDESAVLDGFTITGGNANAYWPDHPRPYQDSGGGIYNKNLTAGTKRDVETIEYSATISNCKFIANSAAIGGAMYNYLSNPKISGCFFSGNSVSHTCVPDVCWGGAGGAIYNELSSPMINDCVFTGNFAHVGGGLSNNESDPLLQFCTFSENSASSGGGGGMCNDWSSPTVFNCDFSENSSWWGGGMANSYGRPLVVGCIFSENSALVEGGAIFNTQSEPTITWCTFVGNSCDNFGGAISNSRSDAALSNCILAGNWAKRFAGAIQNTDCEPTIMCCTISLNRASEIGGGICCGYATNALVANSILWANSAPQGAQIAVKGGTSKPAAILVEYSTVMAGEDGISVRPNDTMAWGAGNIDCDPCFANLGYWDPNGTPEDANDDYWIIGDYHLKSQGGRWDPNDGRWTIDDVTSPCIDAGDPMTPIGLESFPNAGRINMGAYGGTAEASKSYFGDPPCETIVAGDVNGDCKVNFLDFGIMAIHWLEEH